MIAPISYSISFIDGDKNRRAPLDTRGPIIKIEWRRKILLFSPFLNSFSFAFLFNLLDFCLFRSIWIYYKEEKLRVTEEKEREKWVLLS